MLTARSRSKLFDIGIEKKVQYSRVKYGTITKCKGIMKAIF